MSYRVLFYDDITSEKVIDTKDVGIELSDYSWFVEHIKVPNSSRFAVIKDI